MSEFDLLMNTHVKVRAQIPIESLIHDLDETDTLNVIRALDIAQQDADFTINAIKTLWRSLMGDMEVEDMVAFSKELKRIAKGKSE